MSSFQNVINPDTSANIAYAFRGVFHPLSFPRGTATMQLGDVMMASPRFPRGPNLIIKRIYKLS